MKIFNFYILGKICIKHGHIFVMGILGSSATVPMLQGPERGPVSLRLFLPFEANTKIIENGRMTLIFIRFFKSSKSTF